MRGRRVPFRAVDTSLLLAAAGGVAVWSRIGDRAFDLAWLGEPGPALAVGLTGPGVLLTLLAAASAILPRRAIDTTVRRAPAVLATAAVAFAGDPFLLLAAWLVGGFVERREPGARALPVRIGDAGMVVAVVFVLAGVPGPVAAAGLGLAVLSRICARHPHGALTAGLAGLAAAIRLGPAVGAPPVLAGVVAGGGILIAIAAAVDVSPDRALVRAASARLALAVLASTFGAAGVALDHAAAILPGLGLLCLARAPVARRWRMAAAVLGAATLAGAPPLAGFAPTVRLLAALRAESPVVLALAVATASLAAVAACRAARATLESSVDRVPAAVWAVGTLAAMSLVLGLVTGAGILEAGTLEVVAATAAAAVGLRGLGSDGLVTRDLRALEGTVSRVGEAALRSVVETGSRVARAADRAISRATVVLTTPADEPAAVWRPLVALAVLLALVAGLVHFAPELGGIVGCSPR